MPNDSDKILHHVYCWTLLVIHCNKFKIKKKLMKRIMYSVYHKCISIRYNECRMIREYADWSQCWFHNEIWTPYILCKLGLLHTMLWMSKSGFTSISLENGSTGMMDLMTGLPATLCHALKFPLARSIKQTTISWCTWINNYKSKQQCTPHITKLTHNRNGAVSSWWHTYLWNYGVCGAYNGFWNLMVLWFPSILKHQFMQIN